MIKVTSQQCPGALLWLQLSTRHSGHIPAGTKISGDIESSAAGSGIVLADALAKVGGEPLGASVSVLLRRWEYQASLVQEEG